MIAPALWGGESLGLGLSEPVSGWVGLGMAHNATMTTWSKEEVDRRLEVRLT